MVGPRTYSARQAIAITGVPERALRVLLARGAADLPRTGFSGRDLLTVRALAAAATLKPSDPGSGRLRDRAIDDAATRLWASPADGALLLITPDGAWLLDDTTDPVLPTLLARTGMHPALVLPIGRWFTEMQQTGIA